MVGWGFSRRVAQRASCRALAKQHASSEEESCVDFRSTKLQGRRGNRISFHTCGTTGIFASRPSTLEIAFQLVSIRLASPFRSSPVVARALGVSPPNGVIKPIKETCRRKEKTTKKNPTKIPLRSDPHMCQGKTGVIRAVLQRVNGLHLTIRTTQPLWLLRVYHKDHHPDPSLQRMAKATR